MKTLWNGLFLFGLTAIASFADSVSTPYSDVGFGQEVAVHYTASDGIPSGDVESLSIDGEGRPVVTTSVGAARYDAGRWRIVTDSEEPDSSEPIAPSGVQVRHYANNNAGAFLAAGRDGLFERVGEEDWKKVVANDALGRHWGVERIGAATYDEQDRLWFGVQAGLVCRERDSSWRFFEGKDGLPFNRFTCATPGPNGSLWLGTEIGAIRFDGEEWHYRQGRRWLLDDRVISIVVDGEDRTWIGTKSGVTRIVFRALTLRQKAAIYEQEVEQVIKRTSYGYLAPVTLETPGDRSEVRRGDNDNDGLWTSMFGASQCFAFGATGDEVSKKRAEQAFEALRFLQVVTQGGEHSPPKGYVARTIRSTTLPDPNIGRIERDREQQKNRDRLWKVYEPRWPTSADGQWYWKSDTSSDELDGHYFFYPLYHDLVAETEAEKDRVKEVVRNLTDHLIDNGYNLTDHDGLPTRWGFFGPQDLNHNEDWYVERGLNSLSLLSYLTVAEHVTGEARYSEKIKELRENAAYHTNAMVPKLQRGVGSGNQSDDEMAFMSFYNLLRYTKDDGLRQRLLKAFYAYWTLEQPELNPFFNVAYAACAEGQTVSDPWGEHEVKPWEGWLKDSVDTLKAFPLDRSSWGHQNSHRLDLVPLPPQQSVDLFSSRGARGLRVNGKVLPVDERYFNHWNTDPFQFDYPGDGRGLGCGTVFLLPYYMALYHGYIDSPNEEIR
jgi:hypothetical protein